MSNPIYKGQIRGEFAWPDNKEKPMLFKMIYLQYNVSLFAIVIGGAKN